MIKSYLIFRLPYYFFEFRILSSAFHRVTNLRTWRARVVSAETRSPTNETSWINYIGGLISSRNSFGQVDRSSGCCAIAIIRGDRTAGRISRGAFARRLPVGRKWHALKSSNLAFSLSPFPAKCTPVALSPAGSRSVARATEQHLRLNQHTTDDTYKHARYTHISIRTRTIQRPRASCEKIRL